MAAATRPVNSAIRCPKPNGAMPELVRIGFVAGIHGLRGALRIRTDNPDCEIPLHSSRLMLACDGVNNAYGIVSARRLNRGTFKVSLEGISAVETAESLRGAVVSVTATQLPAVGTREFYYFQAVGCEVVTTAGQRVGVIEQVVSTGANEVWVVRDGLTEYLVPVIEDVVKEADWGARRVILEPVPGLLD
jgi:16S rRNA processing protein RimM